MFLLKISFVLVLSLITLPHTQAIKCLVCTSIIGAADSTCDDGSKAATDCGTVEGLDACMSVYVSAAGMAGMVGMKAGMTRTCTSASSYTNTLKDTYAALGKSEM